MNIEKITNELCVEVYATNNEDTKWEVKLFRVRSLKSVYYNESKEEEV